MPFYWGQGVGLPRTLLPFFFFQILWKRPNTMRFLIHVLFWPCTTSQPKASFSSSSQSHSASYKSSSNHEQTAQTADGQKLIRTAKQSQSFSKQSFSQTERNIHKASKCKKHLWPKQTKPFCSCAKIYAKSRSQQTTFCWGTLGREIFFIQFLISPLRLKLSSSLFICLKLLFCKTSN